MKANKVFKFMGLLALTLLAVLTGGAGGVMVAALGNGDPGTAAGETGTNGSDGSATVDGNGTALGAEGKTMGSVTAGMEAEAELYEAEIDKRVTKIRPMSTPLVQLTSYAHQVKVSSPEVRYWSVGTRGIKTTLQTNVTTKTAKTQKIQTNANEIFDIDDTIRVVGIKGRKVGTQEIDNKNDLMLHVSGIDNDGCPIVFAVNGVSSSSSNSEQDNFALPDIPANTVLVRMAKACAEMDSQTSGFANYPEHETQYCQNFMVQVEQSTFDKLYAKEVDWGFTDMEEDAIYDYKLAKEATLLFGVKNKVKHPSKRNTVWYTGGVWPMPAKDIWMGAYDNDKGGVVVHDDEFVDITKELFTGVETGSKKKVALCGSDVIAAFSKTITDRFVVKDTLKVWDMEFHGFKTNFGELYPILSEHMDMMGMSDCAFVIDPEYMTKATFISMGRNVLDLDKLGVRNSQAVVLREVSCLYLRNPKAHARLFLNKPTASITLTKSGSAFSGTTLSVTDNETLSVSSTLPWTANLNPNDSSSSSYFKISVSGDDIKIEKKNSETAGYIKADKLVIEYGGATPKEIGLS